MIKQIHFVSGLRAGSTLLCNLLAQNPSFHATPTSGCVETILHLRNTWNEIPSHRANKGLAAKSQLGVLRAAIDTYHSEANYKIVFDKSRAVLQHLEFIEHVLGRKPKVLVTVRPMAEVLASMEMQHRETSKTKCPPGEKKNYQAFVTQEGRCEYWLKGIVGLEHARIVDAVHRGYINEMHFVNYSEMCTDPQNTMRKIYNFLGEPYYTHDFDCVEQSVKEEDDDVYGYTQLHTIRQKVEPSKKTAAEIIGSQLVEKYSKMNLPFGAV